MLDTVHHPDCAHLDALNQLVEDGGIEGGDVFVRGDQFHKLVTLTLPLLLLRQLLFHLKMSLLQLRLLGFILLKQAIKAVRGDAAKGVVLR